MRVLNITILMFVIALLGCKQKMEIMLLAMHHH